MPLPITMEIELTNDPCRSGRQQALTRRVFAMCNNHHDGTCTAVLTRSEIQPNQLVMMLVCESCDEIVKVMGSFEHAFKPLIEVVMPHLTVVPADTQEPQPQSNSPRRYHSH